MSSLPFPAAPEAIWSQLLLAKADGRSPRTDGEQQLQHGESRQTGGGQQRDGMQHNWASLASGLPTLTPQFLKMKGRVWRPTDTFADEVVLLKA